MLVQKVTSWVGIFFVRERVSVILMFSTAVVHDFGQFFWVLLGTELGSSINLQIEQFQ